MGTNSIRRISGVLPINAERVAMVRASIEVASDPTPGKFAAYDLARRNLELAEEQLRIDHALMMSCVARRLRELEAARDGD